MRISDWSSDVCSSDLGFPSENVYCVGLAILSLERPANVRILDFSRELIRDEPPRYGWAKFPIGTAAPVTPRWEPAGRWIAYLKREHGLTQVWRVDVGTGAASPVKIGRASCRERVCPYV